MQFHGPTLERIRKSVPPGQLDEISEAEKILGVKFPAAVREWYSDIDGRFVLERYSNGDHALPPTEFTLHEIDDLPIVKFMTENQGVCWWGFLVGDEDDPPVYVNMDAPPDELFEYSPSFTEFAYVWVFDHEEFWDEDRCSMDTCDPITADDLSFLGSRFKTEPRSEGWPGNKVYRYSSPTGRITIWASDQQSDWIMSASSPDDLAALRKQVIHLWKGHCR